MMSTKWLTKPDKEHGRVVYAAYKPEQPWPTGIVIHGEVTAKESAMPSLKAFRGTIMPKACMDCSWFRPDTWMTNNKITGECGLVREYSEDTEYRIFNAERRDTFCPMTL